MLPLYILDAIVEVYSVLAVYVVAAMMLAEAQPWTQAGAHTVVGISEAELRLVPEEIAA